jgi:hypothetical protein
MKKLSGLSQEAIDLYRRDLMAAYRQLAFELLIAILLMLAIFIIRHHFLLFITALMVLKIWFSWDRLDLMKKGKLTYMKIEEWENLTPS